MLFSSAIFVIYFFPVVFLVYYLLSFSRPMQNIWLFLASLLFYAWGEPVNLLLLLGSILVNWLCGMIIQACKGNKSRKCVLVIACIANLGLLAVFKYTGFFIDQVNSLAGQQILPAVKIALPIGISFFTFQGMSYVIDVYKRTVPAEKNPFYVGLYVAFFPQLVAGPIVRYNSVAEQIRKRKSNINKVAAGACRFLTGLAKKVLIADTVAIVADTIFNWSEFGIPLMDVPVTMAWLGIIAYTLQIYFDFSGYSDMAIGLGLIFGFEFDENFNYPYTAVSVSDFWKRWHISLTSWFREYVYFPLGGSRVENKDTMVRNMFIVWMLTGIWHGAGWNFVLWGLWHFMFQLMERFFRIDRPRSHLGLMRVYTLLEVMFGWVLFRTTTLYQAYSYYRNLLGLSGNSFWSAKTWFMIKEYWVYLLLGVVFSMPIGKMLSNYLESTGKGVIARGVSIVYPVVMMIVFSFCIAYIIKANYSPFIYFNF